MRLGAQSSDVKPGTLAHEIYGGVVTERHRHRYEANEHYLERLQHAGLVVSAITQREKLTEIVELPQERAPVVHRRAVPPRVQVARRGTVTRCSTRFIKAALRSTRRRRTRGTASAAARRSASTGEAA